MSEIVTEREAKAKTKMKEYYDGSAKEKHFERDAWEGPYEIGDQISPVTYGVKMLGRAAQK